MIKKKKFLVLLWTLLIFIMFSLFVAGCEDKSDTDNSSALESGFQYSNSEDEVPTLYCAYKSEKTEFYIDDVTLDFYYGGYYHNGVEFELENIYNFPYFELYFIDNDGNSFFVKRIEENFVSEKYSCEVVYDENWYITEVIFKYSEAITIPQEIFKEESGKIYFSIYATNILDYDPQIKCITGISIFYKVINNKVILSNQLFN